MFPQLARFTDLGLLRLRLMVGLVCITTIFLGIAKVSGALGLAFGVLTQVAAFGLIALMLGAIQKKIFSWHTGFWGEKTYGWHYELMFIPMNLLIAFTDGGTMCC